MFTEASEPSRQGNSIMAPEEKEKLAKKTTFQPVKILSTALTNWEPIAPFPHGDAQASY